MAPWAASARGIDPEGDRAVVHELDVHVLAERSATDRRAPGLQGLRERLDPVLGDLGRGGPVPRGPPALADVAVQRELRNDQDLATHVRQRAVHLAVLVLEHPEVEDLLRQPVVLAEPVVGSHADEQEEAGSDRGHELVTDRDRGSVDALEQDPQRGTTRKAS